MFVLKHLWVALCNNHPFDLYYQFNSLPKILFCFFNGFSLTVGPGNSGHIAQNPPSRAVSMIAVTSAFMIFYPFVI